MKALYLLMVLIAASGYVLLVQSATGSGCALGFLDLDLIKKRALKIPHGKQANTSLNNEFRLVPDWNFTCDGSITTLYLGVSLFGSTAAFDVQIWRKSETNSNQYRKVHSLTNFYVGQKLNVNGVTMHEVTPPLRFKSGDVLGIYQGGEWYEKQYSMKLFYKEGDKSAPLSYQLKDMNPSVVTLGMNSSLVPVKDQYILFSLVTEPSCGNGFLSFEAIKQKTLDVNIERLRKHKKKEVLIPALRFACNGNITKWYLGGEIRNSSGTELQLWRNQYGGYFVKVGSAVVNASDPDGDHVFEFIPNPPMEFQMGDILGMYQKGRVMSRGKVLVKDDGLLVYYQRNGGGTVYQNWDYKLEPPSPIMHRQLICDLEDTKRNTCDDLDQPLVSVEIIRSPTLKTPSATILIEQSTYVSPSMDYEVCVDSSVKEVVETSSVLHTSMSANPVPIGSNELVIIVAVVIAVIMMVILSAMAIVVTIVLRILRNGGMLRSMNEYNKITAVDNVKLY